MKIKEVKMRTRKLSDIELVDKYNFMVREIERMRKNRRLGLSRDIIRNIYLAIKMTEYKYILLKEIKKRGLTCE